MNGELINTWIKQGMCKRKMNYSGQKQQRRHRIFATALLFVIALIFILSCFSSCKTVGTVKENINVRDSVAIRWKDSTAIHWIDSIRYTYQHVIRDDSTSLIINFGQGGGTYNAKTGDATNVSNVQQTDTHHEEKDSTAYYRNLYANVTAVADSLSNRCTQYEQQIEEERKKARSGYDRFCSTWFWITAILLFIKIAAWVMEKIPATAPYITIARKFVPFL